MDFFATLFSIAFDTANSKPVPSTPIDADSGVGTNGSCIVV